MIAMWPLDRILRDTSLGVTQSGSLPAQLFCVLSHEVWIPFDAGVFNPTLKDPFGGSISRYSQRHSRIRAVLTVRPDRVIHGLPQGVDDEHREAAVLHKDLKGS